MTPPKKIAALCAATTVTGLLWPWPAHAATPRSSATYSWSTPTVRDGRLNDDLTARIRSLRKGAQLDLLLYSVNRPDMVDAVLAAADRGVKVRLLTSHAKPDGEDDGVPLWGEMDRLVNGLRARHQTVKVGWGSLSRSGKAGIEHRKLVLIDDGHGRQSVTSDSGNWVYATDQKAFNDRLEVVDRCMYAGELKHFDVLMKDRDVKTSKGAVVASCDGVRRLYNLPEAKTDPVLSWAKRARCGKGDLVVFANFYFTSSKSALTTELIRFRKAGARVEVAANDAKWSDAQRKRMVKAGVKVVDVNGRVVYDHRKMLAAEGCGAPFGAQGSTTMNATAYEKNGNQIVTTTSAADVHAMLAGFSAMTKNGVK